MELFAMQTFGCYPEITNFQHTSLREAGIRHRLLRR
jgi:hypothetical protein